MRTHASQDSWTRKFLVVGAALAIAIASGCSSAQKSSSGDEPSASLDGDWSGNSDEGKAGGLQSVNFGYDSFVLSSSTKDALRGNAQLLKDNPSVRVQIEGHCDERGSIQYNIALGDKRASAVRNYLVDLGVSGDRLTTISFGKERPLDPRSNEAAWGKNRRANFVITAQ